MFRFNKILVANDGSEGARKALRVAVELAKRFDAELHSISVEEDLPHYAATVGEVIEAKHERNAYFHKVNEEGIEFAAKEGVTLNTKVVAGHEVEKIVDHINVGKFDLLVIGFMGHSRVFGRIWGSTSQTLARLAPCTVMVVK
ncbi:MAG TPA: universal stress protein [Thermodesulfobacteriota bacterium]|jgi:nucleotide-binding universal stress UspA family protein